MGGFYCIIIYIDETTRKRSERIIKTDQKSSLYNNLLSWYHANQRQMPWREDKNPYRIWISEIMLQRTKVQTVVPYFIRFIQRFPTVNHLARASEQEVIKLWEGLGYYSRARNLLKGANYIKNRFDGALPCSYDELVSIPGIGDYTAGAILSIAFNKKYPAVDGNVLRVIARIHGITENINESSTRSTIRNLVEGLIPDGKASDFNQGLMELGALICIPRNPKCDICPMYELCQARIHQQQVVLPVKVPKAPPKKLKRIIVIILREGRILLRKRPENGLLGGLWEFPGWDVREGDDDPQAYLAELGIASEVDGIQFIGSAQHTFSHIQWLMKGFLCQIKDSMHINISEEYVWVFPEQISKLPIPTALKKFKEWVLENSPIHS